MSSKNTRPLERQIALLAVRERKRMAEGGSGGGEKDRNNVGRKRDETAQSHTTRHQIHLYFACSHAIRLPFPFQGQRPSRPLDTSSDSGNRDSLHIGLVPLFRCGRRTPPPPGPGAPEDFSQQIEISISRSNREGKGRDPSLIFKKDGGLC